MDVPTYVRYGAADLGVAGKDCLLEYASDAYYEWLDLRLARCRLMTAAAKGRTPITGRLRVATKYVRLARQHYAAKGQQADIIQLYGGMELAAVMNLADEIVDIVDTGNTLEANGLEPLDLLADISSRLIVGRASLKLKHAELSTLLERIEQALKDRADS